MSCVFFTGANRGIGLEFVRQYAADGWRVIATCRDLDSAADLARIAEESDGRVARHSLDVTDASSVAAVAEALASASIDVLINNAGTADTPAAPSSSASSSPCDGRCRTAGPPRDGSDPRRQPPVEPPHRAPRSTSPAPRRNRQGTMSGAFLRRRDRTARSLRVVHYSSAVNTCRRHVPRYSINRHCSASDPYVVLNVLVDRYTYPVRVT